MSEVKRYGFKERLGLILSEERPDGNYVTHQDYAELKAQRDALVAENAALKVISNDRRSFIMNGVQMGYIKVPTVETDPALETIRIAVSPQEPTPATDAYINSVRAEGAEMVKSHPAISLCSLTHVCEEIAAQLRTGKDGD